MTVCYRMRQILSQNATAMLLQNAKEVHYKIRQVFHYKMRQFYYKIQQCFITKCDVQYKLIKIKGEVNMESEKELVEANMEGQIYCMWKYARECI